MLRATDDVAEMRHWAEERGARPCRGPRDGRLALAMPGEGCPGIEVGWDEFEPTFCIGRCVFVYDDAPSGRTWFIGSEREAREFAARAVSGSPAPPAC